MDQQKKREGEAASLVRPHIPSWTTTTLSGALRRLEKPRGERTKTTKSINPKPDSPAEIGG